MRPDYIQLNDQGQEVPDTTPIVIRVRGKIVTDVDRIRDYIRRELREHKTGELETFEEANDFDVDDDLFPVSPHEYNEDTEAADKEALAAFKFNRERFQARLASQDNSAKPEVSAPAGSPTQSATPSPEAPAAS